MVLIPFTAVKQMQHPLPTAVGPINQSAKDQTLAGSSNAQFRGPGLRFMWTFGPAKLDLRNPSFDAFHKTINIVKAFYYIESDIADCYVPRSRRPAHFAETHAA